MDLRCLQKPIIITCGSERVNELVNDKLVDCCSIGIFKYKDIFVAKATHIFSAKNINVFAIFQDRNFNIMLANNCVQF